MSPKQRYLVADDDLDMRSWLRFVLGARGAACQWARDGAELLRLLAEEGPFDLVVTDFRMPGLAGSQVLAMARTAGLHTPFIVVTAYADERLHRTAAQLDDVLVVEKPLDAIAFGDLASWFATRHTAEARAR